MANKIQIKRGVFASLPTLSAGELGFSTDEKRLHIGDGTKNYESVMADVSVDNGFPFISSAGAKVTWRAVTKGDVGLSNANNTSDSAKPVSTAQQTALNLKENSANKGSASGYAGLDSGGKVPSTQLPSYVDDVLDFANLAAFPTTGTTSIIYIANDTNKTYRWSGSAYVYITSGAVDSVNSKTGIVTLTTSDIAEGSREYFTQSRVINNASVLANTAKVTFPGFGVTSSTAAYGNHNHSGVYEPVFSKGSAFNKNFSTTASTIKMNGAQSLGSLSTLARADHVHPIDTSRMAVGSIIDGGAF